jgi:hypothetical protein
MTYIEAGDDESGTVELCWMLDNGEETGIVALRVMVTAVDTKVLEL